METLITSYGFYTVRTAEGREHDMVLCNCCYTDTAEYYRLIGWKFWHVRTATARESFDHVCLD